MKYILWLFVEVIVSKTFNSSVNQIKDINTWKQFFAEFFATGFFVFIGSGAVVSTSIASSGVLDAGRLVAIALAHGLAICLLAYSVGHISGGHINPAITIAAIINRKINWVMGNIFILGQISGAIVFAFILKFVIPDVHEGNLGAHGLGEDVSIVMGFGIELIFTFLLSFVVFATAMDKRSTKFMAPLAIGITVAVVHLVAVPLTGAGINPARSLGPAIASGFWINHWIYWVAPIFGSVLGGTFYQLVFAERN